MIDRLNSIGWTEIDSDTINKLNHFKLAFRKYYHTSIVTDKDLDLYVANSFGQYTKDKVDEIYKTSIIYIEGLERLSEAFSEFVEMNRKTLSTYVFAYLDPVDFIRLFIEYIYSIYKRCN